MTKNIMAVRGLSVAIKSDRGIVRVLEGIDLDIRQGEVLGVVGESGCGKTTLVKTILGILPRNVEIAGEIRFETTELLQQSESELTRNIRGKRIGFVPQDPYLALNPVFTVGAQLLEIMRWHAVGSRRDHRSQMIDMFKRVRLPDAEAALGKYPHQFSGGQRQRLLIAAALVCHPALIIADEPTTALDVTTQSEILVLLRELISEFGVSMMFVTHDLGVVAQICDRVCVLYKGHNVETADTESLLSNPQHRYTRALISCHPDRSNDFVGIEEMLADIASLDVYTLAATGHMSERLSGGLK